MFRNIVRVVGLLGVLYAAGVAALGLGDVQLNSGLNEPLDAEIKLLNVGDLNASQIRIKLASPEDFARAGAERDFFLTNFKYETQLDGKGGGVVKITTNELVREPYLNFLLEAKWPSGKLVREYTLLVDLPVFKSSGNAPRVSRAPANQVAATTASRPPANDRQPAKRQPVTRAAAPQTQMAAAPAASQSAPTGNQANTVTTRRHDTLWKLAQQVRPSAEISPQKVMVAMQALNPDAFIDNNINLLKTGAVLRVPSLEDIERIDADRARAVVAAHNERWRSSPSATPAPRQLDATPARSEPQVAETAARDAGSLRLTTGVTEESDPAASGTSGGAGDASGNAAKLAAAEELLEDSNAENDMLRGRVETLEAELAALKNRLQVRDNDLAKLQRADTAVADEQSAEQKAELAAAKASAGDAAAETEQSPTPAADSSPGLLATILDNPLYLGALVLLLLALVAGLFIAKRRAADEGFDVMEDMETEEQYEEEVSAPVAMEATAEQVEEEAQDFADYELESLDDETVESEIGDPVAEADIYMAYGRFPQAVELLNRALEQEPERTDLRLKLVEVHMGAGAPEEARQQMALLETSGDTEAFQQAQALLGQAGETQEAGADYQPGEVDEFNRMLAESEALGTDDLEPEVKHAANEEFSATQPLAEDEAFAADIRAASGAADGTEDTDFDLELDFEDPVAEVEKEIDLADLELEPPLEEKNLDIEAELADLSADLGMGENAIDVNQDTLAEAAGTQAYDEPVADAGTLATEYEPDLNLDISDEEIAELEQSVAAAPGNENTAELDLVDAADETATKIDLARAYIDMGDTEGAKDILSEVLDEAENEQKQEAQELLDRIA